MCWKTPAVSRGMLVCVNTYLSTVFPEGGNKWSLSNGAKDGGRGSAYHYQQGNAASEPRAGAAPLLARWRRRNSLRHDQLPRGRTARAHRQAPLPVAGHSHRPARREAPARLQAGRAGRGPTNGFGLSRSRRCDPSTSTCSHWAVGAGDNMSQ